MNATRTVSNDQDVIDSRDVIARIENLLASLEVGEYADERAELIELEALADQCSGYADDWSYGVTLVRDSYFVEYARELANDLGIMLERPDAQRWPFTCIDWQEAARRLRMDYTSVDFAGVTYWVR